MAFFDRSSRLLLGFTPRSALQLVALLLVGTLVLWLLFLAGDWLSS
jgi:hypothetical protein